MVTSLINHTSKNWNGDLLKEVFTEEEAKFIANIPLSPLLPEDRLIWCGTASGNFTVRSAYHLGKEEQERRASQCSKGNTGQDVWKTLWAMELPNVVKMFVWRACQNILPTRMNLFKRKIIEEAKCPCYEVEDEILIHALWTCPTTQDVWGSKTSPFEKFYASGVSFKEVFEDRIQRYSKEVLELLVVVARGIWFRRNKLVFEGAFSHPDNIFSAALNFIREYKESLVKDKPLVQSEMDPGASRDTATCSPPPDGFKKINWDAAINKTKGWIGLGIIAKDYLGNCLGTRSLTKILQADAKTAESLAALEAFQFAKEAGFLDVIFEGDATHIIEEINSNPPYLSRAGHILESIHVEWRSLRTSSFKFVFRESNCVAHCLAKEAASIMSDLCLLEDTPTSISSIVLREAISP